MRVWTEHSGPSWVSACARRDSCGNSMYFIPARRWPSLRNDAVAFYVGLWRSIETRAVTDTTDSTHVVPPCPPILILFDVYLTRFEYYYWRSVRWPFLSHFEEYISTDWPPQVSRLLCQSIGIGNTQNLHVREFNVYRRPAIISCYSVFCL